MRTQRSQGQWVQGPISYFADMVASPLLAALLSLFALSHFTSRALAGWCLLVVIGAGAWTLAEYVMHRLVYHRLPVLRQYHLVHHEHPKLYVGAPPFIGTGIVFLASFLPLAAFSVLLASAASVGMLVGYAGYMIVHHACHHWTLTPGSYLYRARLRHSGHHYRSQDGNFGVTTSFWDRAMRTRVEPHAAPEK